MDWREEGMEGGGKRREGRSKERGEKRRRRKRSPRFYSRLVLVKLNTVWQTATLVE